jgi:hypothetical protein
VGSLVAHRNPNPDPNPEGAGVSAPVAQVEELVTATLNPVLNEALKVVSKVAKNENVYIKIDPADVIYASVNGDWEARRLNVNSRIAYIVLRNGIVVEAREYFNQLRIESIHECDCVCRE